MHRLVHLALVASAVVAAGCRSGTPPRSGDPLEASLSAIIEHEIRDKSIPAFSIALVDDQEIVWAEGFGTADPDSNVPATADTVYRVGSVSKLFTDIAVMDLVERGVLELDTPIQTYVPELSLDNPWDRDITLRQLMAHRSGLIREPPVGNYFDPGEPSLEATIESLAGQRIVYQPESRVKYSNAAVALVGYVLERTQQTPFADYVRTNVLDAYGMTHSDFAPTARVSDRLAHGVMWTYDGRTFGAPTFQLGMAPAGSLYSSVSELSKFLRVVFAGDGVVLERATLDSMFEPQFRDVDPAARYGLGFSVGELEGRRLLGHGGAIYGFSTELMFLPDEKLGVVAIASKDFTNAVVSRIASHALRSLAARKDRSPLPEYETTEPLPPGRARELAARYDVVARGDRLLVDVGARLMEVRARRDELLVDSPLGYGAVVNLDELDPAVETLPDDIPERWRGLIGEYGWDHNTLYILEKDGRLHALIEWFESYPLEPLDETGDRFAFPDFGLYHGEELVFERGPMGVATAVTAASVRFDRRELGAVDGETFRIAPLQPVSALREVALKALPPVETGEKREPDFVEPAVLEPSILLDIRYATTNNFMGSVFYDEPRAFLQRPAAEALVRAHRDLEKKGYGILIHDAYRPWYVTKMFWDATPDEQKIFVADPASGSRHNRGAAADITLYQVETNEPVTMVGGYDEFSPRSFPDYPGGTSRQRWLRELLRRVMESEGFDVYEFEWWHFDYHDWNEYPISNVTFDELGRD